MLNETEGRWTEILCDSDALVVSLFRRAGGLDGPELHVHRTHTDAFVVLEGTLVVPLGPQGEPEQVPAGSVAVAPPLVAHGFRMDEGDVTLLNVHAPGAGFAEYMRDTIKSFDQEDPPADARPRTDAVVGAGRLLVERPGLRVVLLADTPQLTLSEVRSAPGPVEASPDAGERHSGFYVLEGELGLRTAGRELVAEGGAWISLPAGVPRELEVRSDARYLHFRVPA